MIHRPLKIALLTFLWGALLEDTTIFLLSWLTPDLWFHLFHASVSTGLEVALLRRAGGQWLAFAMAQAIALWRWEKAPIWLVIVAAVRFSDLFTDISYLVSASSLTTLAWILLLPPPLLNAIGIVILLCAYSGTRRESASTSGL